MKWPKLAGCDLAVESQPRPAYHVHRREDLGNEALPPQQALLLRHIGHRDDLNHRATRCPGSAPLPESWRPSAAALGAGRKSSMLIMVVRCPICWFGSVESTEAGT